MRTLEELSFGFRPQDDMTAIDPHSENNTWHTGHPPNKIIIAAISPLTNLVRLGVFGDEYIADWTGSDWAWHRFFKEHVWFHQGRSRISKGNADGPGDEHMLSKALRGHNRSGNKTENWMTSWVTGEAEDPQAAVCEIAAKYAEAIPRLQEFISGRVLVKIIDRK